MATPQEDKPLILPLGDSAAIIRFGTAIDPVANRRAMALAEHLLRCPFPGLVEAVPAYASVTVHYNPCAVHVSSAAPTPYDAVRARLSAVLAEVGEGIDAAPRTVEIPVCYGGDHGPDLEAVAAACGLAPEEVVGLHAGTTYHVYAIGFAPGFPYLGTVPEPIRVPRRATPRAAVPAGSVGIAGAQTGIYPMETPGGWQIIGRTPIRLFQPDRDPPCLLRVGDRVRFRPITEEAFAAWPDGDARAERAIPDGGEGRAQGAGQGPAGAGT
ncbi:5-oxoprolinase subunit PxpB [Calditerricola satsumensis]|uniref:Kinase A inhibitor n=2 Tax=Calditerricola satsumensis TaxID=373054 RepID=A0A8J3B8W9_9BACI|nr:5-oxoprolinase subunit PxpB [Calditerricola satsumensis]GGJ96539.1 kinase A inhibitor [Calditerricola satsumensis]